MDISQEEKNLIDKSLRQALTEAEKAKFENLMKRPEFAEEVKFSQNLLVAFKAYGREQRKLAMSEAAGTIAPKTKRLTPRHWIAYAAGAALIVGAVWMLSQSNFQSGQLFQAYFEPYPSVVHPATRGEDEVLDPYLAYDMGNYQLARQLFADTRSNDTTLFYLAMIDLIESQPLAARDKFSMMNLDTSSSFYFAHQWYYALSALALSEESTAPILFKHIADNGSQPYQHEAAKILQLLQK